MTYAATVDTNPNPATIMSLFNGVSNDQLLGVIRKAEREAAQETSRDLRPIILAIAKGQPYSLPEVQPKMGPVSRFLARMGL